MPPRRAWYSRAFDTELTSVYAPRLGSQTSTSYVFAWAGLVSPAASLVTR
jgi:hypothetical protein